MKKVFMGVSAMALAVVGLVLGSGGVSAAAPSATSTLDSLMTVIINTTVSLATTIFTNYWPYILVFGVITTLIVIFSRFLHLKK